MKASNVGTGNFQLPSFLLCDKRLHLIMLADDVLCHINDQQVVAGSQELASWCAPGCLK